MLVKYRTRYTGLFGPYTRDNAFPGRHMFPGVKLGFVIWLFGFWVAMGAHVLWMDYKICLISTVNKIYQDKTTLCSEH